jgi:predicted AlkP superfamily phosphohydrolase/phosphomutase
LSTASADTARRVAIIGLDSVPPELVFGPSLEDLPHLRAVIERGVHGPLRSVVPPITVPAWMCMMTSQDPGSLGIYGFRNRFDHSYDGLHFASSASVAAPALWDLLGRDGRQTIALGVPLTYPPRRIAGHLVSCFLTPDTNRAFTHPPLLATEVERVADGYVFDVTDFRTTDKDRLLRRLYGMMEKRFRVARRLLATKPWNLFVMVEMAPDRLHHAFWRYTDRTHRLYEPGNAYEAVLREFYARMDAHVGEMLAEMPEDTVVFIVSDHGTKRMDGGICLNEWLIRNGYLVLKEPPSGPTRWSPALVDWERTRAWGDGGYYGRIFLNVRGREPRGIVAPHEAEALKDELIQRLEALGDPNGNGIGSRVYRPEELYREVRGVPPDLIAIFGNLHWRCIAQVGTGQVHVFENDTGPDDANHAEMGVLVAAGPGVPHQPAPIAAMDLLDVAPTVLEVLGIVAPPHFQGTSLLPRFRTGTALTEEDE